MGNISFGDWIEVAGERPWWLRNGEPYQVGGEAPVFYSRTDPDYYWGGTTRMRVRADHPYYTAKPFTPSNEELTQRIVLSPEMQARLVALARQVASVPDWMIDYGNVIEKPAVREAKSIVSDLPKPVDPIDPDLERARKVVFEHVEDGYYLDSSPHTQIALAAIKLGRTLAAGGTAHE